MRFSNTLCMTSRNSVKFLSNIAWRHPQVIKSSGIQMYLLDFRWKITTYSTIHEAAGYVLPFSYSQLKLFSGKVPSELGKPGGFVNSAVNHPCSCPWFTWITSGRSTISQMGLQPQKWRHQVIILAIFPKNCIKSLDLPMITE